MSINRMKSWLAFALLLGLPSFAAAQELPEDAYLPGVDDVQWFDRADLSAYGNGQRRPEGYFFTGEALQWAISPPEETTIGKEGFSPLAAGSPRLSDDLGFVNQPNSLTTGFIEANLGSGSRFQLGRICDDRGWMLGSFVLHSQTQNLTGSNAGVAMDAPFVNGVSVLEGFVDINVDGFADDLNFNNVFGPDGIDLGTPNDAPPPAFILPFDGIPDAPFPTDFSDLVSLPIIFKNVYVRHSAKAWGVEAMRLWRLKPGKRGGWWEILAGARYMKFDDELWVHGEGEVFLYIDIISGLPFDGIHGALADSKWDTTAENNIVGPQLGLRYSRQRGRFGFSAEGRFLAGTNMQSIRQLGFIANPPRTNRAISIFTLVPGDPLNLFPTAFQHTFKATEFAPVAELRVDASYQLFSKVSFNVGWTGMFADGIARSSNMIDYTLPSMGILGQHNRQDLIINGINFGIVINR
ncbi:MAG: BBP7 family outer membrane beta-barrel protein [Pirellulales bacterium]